MVCCAIASCSNHSRQASKLGIKFHIFPKNSETKDSDYERDLKSELLNIPSKRKLKTDAIPTVNLPSSSADLGRRNKRTTRAQKRIYCKEDILQESTEVDVTQTMSSEIEIKQEPESTEEDETPTLPCEVEIKEEPIFNDPCQQPLEDFQQIYIKEENVIFNDPCQQPVEDFQQIYIKEENVKCDIPEDHGACDPLQLKQEELRNEASSTICKSEPKSIPTADVEVDTRTGGICSLVARDAPPTGMGNTIRSTFKQEAFCGITRSSNHLEHNCSICGKTFANFQDMKEHKHVVSHDFLHSCSVCHKTFKTNTDLNNHLRVHKECTYKCEECHKVFKFHSRLRTHSLVHTAERPHTCGVCHKTFAQRENLIVHARKHSGEKPYVCTVCQKKFTYSCTLKIHLRSHTGERPYTCGVCQKAFTQSSSLKSHSRIHTGERPYSCAICHKEFFRKNRLRYHVTLHTGNRP